MEQTAASIKLEDRVRWYTKMRWFYLLPLALAGILPQLAGAGYNDFVRDQISIVSVAVMANIGFWIIGRHRNGSKGYYIVLAIAQLFFDVILGIWLVLLNGGIESRTVIIFVIPIIMAGALLGRLAVYITALGSAMSYILIVTLDHFGIIQPPNQANPLLHIDRTFYMRSVFFYGGVLIIIAMLVDYVGHFVRSGERIEAEMRAVSAEQAKTKAIVASMGDALVAVNLDANITLVNDSFERLTGWKKEEVIGQSIDDVLKILNEKGEPISSGQRPLLQALQGKPDTQPQRVTDFYYKRKNGKTFPFIAYTASIVLDGRVIGATTVFQDSTKLQEVQQLRNNFVALASHQLKTPIVEIQGYLENMVGGVVGKLTKQQQEYIRLMYEISERCTQLLTDLLDITLLERGSVTVNSKPTSLSRILKQVEKIYRGRMSWKHLQLKIIEADGDLAVIADHNKLVECIGNVITNAIRFSKVGSIDIQTHREGLTAVIDVRDHGSGVDRDAIVDLFEKDEVLSVAPTAEGGTGLGLYLAKQLVILQGGSIALTETSNKGTTITIRLRIKGG